MTNPNLDALAKLAPFTVASSGFGGDVDYEFLSTADLLGAGLWRDPAPKDANP